MKFFICLIGLVFMLFSCQEKEQKSKLTPLLSKDGSSEYLLNYLNQAIGEDDDDDFLLFKRAELYFELGRYIDASDDIKTTISIKQGKSNYHLLAAQIYFKQKMYFEALKAIEKAESLGENNPDLMVLKSKMYWALEDTSGCYLYLDKANQIVPFHSDVQLLKGLQLYKRGDSLKAVGFYKRAIDKNPNNIDAYTELVKYYINNQYDDSALVHIVKAQLIDTKNINITYYEGVVYRRKDLLQSAILSFHNCINIDSSYVGALNQLGALYIRRGDFDNSLKYYKKLIQFDDKNIGIINVVIEILNKQQKEIETIDFYEKLVKLDPDNAMHNNTLSKLYKKYADESKYIEPVVQEVIKPSVIAKPIIIVKKDTTSRMEVPVIENTVSDSLK